MIRASLRLLRWLPRPLRLLCASGLATTVDAVVLFALSLGAGLPPGPAAILGCLAGGAVNFALTRSWVFTATDRAWIPQALRYGVVVVGGGAVVSGLAVAAACAGGAPLVAAKGIAVLVTMVTWTYPLSARVVFAPTRPPRIASVGETSPRPIGRRYRAPRTGFSEVQGIPGNESTFLIVKSGNEST